MSTRKTTFVSIAVATLAAACGGNAPLPPPPKAPTPVPWTPPSAQTAEDTAPRETPDAEFRKQEPQAGDPITFTPPKFQSFALKNGVKVLLAERHELPIVDVEIVTNVGAGDLANARPGVMSMMGAMIEQGTKSKTALELSDAFEALGAQHGAFVDWDLAATYVKVLSSRVDDALDLLADVTLHPSFPDKELDRLKTRRLAALKQEAASPGAMANNALVAALYGRGHPYGHSIGGREDDVKKMTRADLVAAYGRVFVPGHTTIVVAGDTTRDAIAGKLEARFGEWKAGVAEKGSVPRVAPFRKGTPRIVLVDKPGAPQSQVWVSEPGVSMSLPEKERDALHVANSILGGMFSSRVNLNLREAHAYTYGARSHFTMRHGQGPFRVGAAVKAENTIDSIKEIMKEIDRIRGEAVTDDELKDAKENTKLALPGRFETVDELARAMGEILVYGLPLDVYSTEVARVDAVTKDDVLRVMKTYLHPEQMRIVVVGDRKKLEADLTALGYGGVEIRDAYGDPAK